MSDIDIHVMDGWEDKLEADIETALEAVGLQAEGYAALELENSPRRVDTGLLRNSITHAVGGGPTAKESYHADAGSSRNSEGKRKSASAKTAGAVKVGFYSGNAPPDSGSEKSVWIGSNVEYAPYVHDGTMHMTPNRFLKNALEKHKDEYKRMIEHYLRS